MSRQNCLIEKEGIELFLDYVEKENDCEKQYSRLIEEFKHATNNKINVNNIECLRVSLSEDERKYFKNFLENYNGIETYVREVHHYNFCSTLNTLVKLILENKKNRTEEEDYILDSFTSATYIGKLTDGREYYNVLLTKKENEYIEKLLENYAIDIGKV